MKDPTPEGRLGGVVANIREGAGVLLASLRALADAAWMTLVTDRLLQVAVALAVAVVGFLVLPVLTLGQRQTIVAWVGPALFALLIPVAFLHGGTRGRAAERGFWRDLTWASWCALASVVLRRIGVALDWPVAGLLAGLGLMISYTLIVVAVERQPQRQTAESRGLELRLTLPTILLLVVGLLLYFVVIPIAAEASLGMSPQLMVEIFVVLGTLLMLRVGFLAFRSESVRWRSIYLLLALLAAAVVANHGRGQPFFAQAFGAPGVAGRSLWLIPMLLAVVLARLRHHPFPAEPRAEVDMVTRLGDHPGGLALRTMFIALTVPTLHFGGYRLGLFDPTLLGPRETWVFFWVLGLGAVALYQNRRLSDQLAAAFRERRRIENALANTERSLRLAETRRQSDEAVWRKKEKYVKAFRYSPDAMLMTRFEDGHLIEFNNRMLEIVGLSRSQAADHTVLDLGLWADPEDHRQVMDGLRRDGHVRGVLIGVRRADGGIRQVQLSAEVMEVEGERCVFAAARDVSARNENLAALQLQAEMLDRSREAVAVFDHEDVVTYWNEAATRLLGRSADQVRGRRAHDALDTPREESLSAVSMATRERGVWHGTLDARSADGRQLTLDTFWARATEADGEPTAKLVFLRPAAVPEDGG